MKELSIEEKAKAYDGNYKAYTEIISRLEDVKDAIKKQNYGIAMDILCKPYPEFQITIYTEHEESEDERMRNVAINACKYMIDNFENSTKQYEEAIAWLEKQGEKTSDKIAEKAKTEKQRVLLTETDGVANIDWDTRSLQDVKLLLEYGLDYIKKLEKQGEHANFLNKIQIGDKVTRNEDGVLVNLSQLKRIAKPAEKQGKNNMGISEATKKKLEDSLNEALEKETPESFNEFLDEQELQESDHIDYISGIRVGLLSIEGNAENINGLTESQWVAIRAANRLLGEYIDKEQSRPWSEEDEEIHRKCICAMRASACGFPEEEKFVEQVDNWLKDLKERVLPQKQEWSEGDEDAIGMAIIALDDMYSPDDPDYTYAGYSMPFNKAAERLKSLRPQNKWKPSDEQIEALDSATENCAYSEYQDCLRELIGQLKKLREE